MNKEDLIKVYKNTKDIISEYSANSTTKKFINNQYITNHGDYIPNISVVNMDTISTALTTIGRTCILNMASEKKGGGGVENGKVAQEECLFRCTNLFETITQDFYPLNDDECLYTRDAIIVKDVNYNEITPFRIDCITMAALNQNKNLYEDLSWDVVHRNKIGMMLDLAASNECENVVLGAWGCGVFKNNPKKMASLFLKVIYEKKYNFKNIFFGIINDNNSVDNNYNIFKQILS